VKILLTNDDGVNAKGMSILREIALQLSDDVWICAPHNEQSATSRKVSLHEPVRLRKLEDKVYSVSGTPTDSVIVALKALMSDSPPDLILSGVNRGQNLAEDVTFSGTVAGAFQGMQMGVPSMALSLARGFQDAQSLPWDTVLSHGPATIEMLLEKGWAPNVVLNVNFPDTAPDAVKGLQYTRQGHRDYEMSGVDRRRHPRGWEYLWMTYGAQKSNPPDGTDLRAIYDGYISVTPLHINLTHEDSLSTFNG